MCPETPANNAASAHHHHPLPLLYDTLRLWWCSSPGLMTVLCALLPEHTCGWVLCIVRRHLRTACITNRFLRARSPMENTLILYYTRTGDGAHVKHQIKTFLSTYKHTKRPTPHTLYTTPSVIGWHLTFITLTRPGLGTLHGRSARDGAQGIPSADGARQMNDRSLRNVFFQQFYILVLIICTAWPDGVHVVYVYICVPNKVTT